MADNYGLIASEILKCVGGSSNVTNSAHCMTRLRLLVVDPNKIDLVSLKKVNGVLKVITESKNVQLVLGPGKATKVSNEFTKLLNTKVQDSKATKTKTNNGLDISADWRENKAKVKTKTNKYEWLTRCMRHLANIFSPLIPAIIAAGLFASLLSITRQLGGTTVQNVWKASSTTANVFFHLFTALSNGFTSYIVIFAGVNAAKEYGATPMLGGFLGGICIIPNITEIAKLIGLADKDGSLNSVLLAGKGGVLGVILACYLLSVVEKFLHKKMPDVLDSVFTPFISILLVGCVYIFGIMIVTGYISDGICKGIGFLTMNNHVIVRIIVGFIAAALFLPLVMTGMHHGLIAFYTTEMKQHGFVSLYPTLAMAGAGQVGAAVALYIKAKKKKNTTLTNNITGAIIPGILGAGEPLIYSVTLPLGTPFITAGLGAGVGGAFVMAMQIGSTAYAGASGIIAIPLMSFVNGKENAMGMLWYTFGLLMAAAAGFLITWFFIKEDKCAVKD